MITNWSILGVVAASHSVTGTSGCGATSTVIFDQSTCGPTAPFPAAPTSFTAISTCNPTITAGGTYKLTADLNCGATSVAINVNGPNTIIDLNGHAVTGFINFNTDTNGIHLYSSAAGASVKCQTDSSAQACVYGNVSSPNFNAVLEIDHFTVQNLTTNSTSSARNLFFDFSSINSGTLTGVPNIKIHHVESISATGITSTRIVNIQVQASENGSPQNKAYPLFYNNKTTCQTNTAACQGIVAYGLWDSKVYNNFLTNQLNNPSSSETPRAVIFDQTYGAELYNNYIVAQDGRAFRFRGTHNLDDVNTAHDNYIDSIVAGSNSNHVAAVHIGDPDSGVETENLTISNNKFVFSSGQVCMQRDATAVTWSNNVITGSGTIPFISLRKQFGNGSVTVTNTSGGTLSSNCDAGCSGTWHLSGTVSGGSCIVV